MTIHHLSVHPSYQLGAGFYRAIQNENARRYRGSYWTKRRSSKVVRKHPIQNTHIDQHGVRRFVRNEIVDYLLSQYEPTLNDIAIRFRQSHPEDYEQLMQLIGYSLSGFGSLASNEDNPCQMRTLAAAERKKDTVL